MPREKLDRIGMEYTHLLTSQLESQRVYFEELVSKAVAKASAASSAAQSATSRADEALAQLSLLSQENKTLKEDIISNLEKDLVREKRKAEKSSEIARGFGKSLMEEVRRVREENEELKESNRDLLFSISAEGKIREMEEQGEEGGAGGGTGLEKGEWEGGTLSLPPEKVVAGRKGKGKGRGK